MLGRIDGGYARGVPLVIERGRSQGADRVREWRETGTRLRRFALPRPADRLLKRRPLPIGAERNAQFTRRVLRGQRPLVLCQQPSAQSSAHLEQLPAARSFGVLHRLHLAEIVLQSEAECKPRRRSARSEYQFQRELELPGLPRPGNLPGRLTVAAALE